MVIALSISENFPTNGRIPGSRVAAATSLAGSTTTYYKRERLFAFRRVGRWILALGMLFFVQNGFHVALTCSLRGPKGARSNLGSYPRQDRTVSRGLQGLTTIGDAMNTLK